MSRRKVMSAVGRRSKLLGGFLLTLLLLYLGVSWYVLKVSITPRRIVNTITPDQLGFLGTESLVFNGLDDGVSLQGWLVPSEGRRVVVLVHGVHSHAWDGSLVELARAYTQGGIDVLLFDMRGHGRSAGSYVGLGLPERGDVNAAVKELLTRGFEAGTIGIHGLSYGAAVALMAAAEVNEIGAVVADSAYADVRDVIAGEIARETGFSSSFGEFLLPGIGFLGRQLYSVDVSKSLPEQVIAGISPRPILLIHGTEDAVIPFNQARRLQAAGGLNVQLWSLTGHGHTEGIRLEPGYPQWSPMRERYLCRVREFFLATL